MVQAYVFWHSPRSGGDLAGYEQSIAAFHASFATDPPAGFLRSTALRIVTPPWVRTPWQAYVDWYLIEGSWALDGLNDAAISGIHRMSHDVVAQAAGPGAGGIYQLRSGDLPVHEAQQALWLTKPDGIRYDQFDADIAQWTHGAQHSLWQRRMVLGPASEFCLFGLDTLTLPAHAEALILRCTAIPTRE